MVWWECCGGVVELLWWCGEAVVGVWWDCCGGVVELL